MSEATQKYLVTDIYEKTEGPISCKLIKDNVYICACREDNQITLKILAHVYIRSVSNSKKVIEGLELKESINVSNFNNHDIPILYDTDNYNYKLLCAREIENNNIECKPFYIEAEYSLDYSYYNIKYLEMEETDYTANFSYYENSCNYTEYLNEYVFCCGGLNIILCERRDKNFNLIDSFNINLPGKISNISFDEYEKYGFKLIYSNETENESGIYEYVIFDPYCLNVRLTLTTFIHANADLDFIYERDTSTNYYISFKNLNSNITILVNDNSVIEEEKILLKDKDNIIYFISLDDKRINEHTMIYTISIEETFSTKCEMSLTVEPCYPSCRTCEKESTSRTNQFCLECKESFYFKENTQNCFTREEIVELYPNYYLDENFAIFCKCNRNCKTCFGPLEDNCLSCPYENMYLNNGTCLCINGTYMTKDFRGNNYCEDCYKNCLTCKEGGNETNMNCDSCLEDKIKNDKECYTIFDEDSKSFYISENDSIISSCYELYQKYIKENSNECITDLEQGYFLYNNTTGLIVQCDSSCKTCSYNRTYCDSCNENFFLQEGICVSNCSPKYYLDTENNKCKKCHENCLYCDTGEEIDSFGNLIIMKCVQCLNESMIKVDGNCFSIIVYNETKILFNISEINPINNTGNCLYFNKSIFFNSYECISKPNNAYYVLNNLENTGVIKYCHNSCDSCLGEYNSTDTNCINCAQGYFKIEDSNTTCILESLIPPNYYKNE